ncbi:MAG: glycoside hydrolase family 127 protein [Rikenellaceae bacterium]|nr:glycoside hydrolase family 127 protein [Rikenellaceae bacterium]
MKYRILFMAALAAVWGSTSCDTRTAFSDELLVGQRELLLSEAGPVVKLKFIPLAPGAVRPEGWIRDWAAAAADGVTGCLDEYSTTYREAWKGKGFVAPGASPVDGTGWPLEQASYWLDGAVKLAYIMQDSALIDKIASRLDRVVNGVLDTGRTFIYWKEKSFVGGDGFNSWAHSHMGRALVAYYQATGDPRILAALDKVYSQYPLPVMHGYIGGNVTGACNVDPMLKTYMMTGNRAILQIVDSMSRSPEYAATVDAWSQGNIDPGHGVVMYENIRIPAMIYPWNGDERQLAATENSFRYQDRNHMLPCGVISSEEFAAGVGSTRNIETCNVACAPLAYQEVMQVTGNGAYGDRIERVFFNAAPAAVSRDYRHVVYYQSPNRVEGVLPAAFPNAPMDADPRGHRLSSYDFRPTGHTVLCCVGNVNRAVPNYIMNMWMATLDYGVAAALYGPSSVRTVAGKRNTPVTITEQTQYPFGDQITLTVDPESKVAFPLYLRLPAWCSAPQLTVNGASVSYATDNGFAVIDRKWKPGDRVVLTLPMEVVVESGVETPYPDIDYFSVECTGAPGGRPLAQVRRVANPYRSVSYGPLLFALPLAELGLNRQAPGARWNYALDVEDVSEDVSVETVPMSGRWSWRPDEAPVRLRVRVREFDWKPTERQPLPAARVKGGEERTVTLVPYGCTRFRISMFPVAE